MTSCLQEFVKSFFFFFFLLKIESVENPTLRVIFELKKNQMRSFTTRRMLQRIPVHFCDMVSRIGFQAEFAPPDGNAWRAALLSQFEDGF